MKSIKISTKKWMKMSCIARRKGRERLISTVSYRSMSKRERMYQLLLHPSHAKDVNRRIGERNRLAPVGTISMCDWLFVWVIQVLIFNKGLATLYRSQLVWCFVRCNSKYNDAFKTWYSIDEFILPSILTWLIF